MYVLNGLQEHYILATILAQAGLHPSVFWIHKNAGSLQKFRLVTLTMRRSRGERERQIEVIEMRATQ